MQKLPEDGLYQRLASYDRGCERAQLHASVPHLATKALESHVGFHVESLREHALSPAR